MPFLIIVGPTWPQNKDDYIIVDKSGNAWDSKGLPIRSYSISLKEIIELVELKNTDT